MFAAVVIVHVVCSIALIAIVLLQAGKGTGISNVFGGAGQAVFGARTADVLTKGTAVCAALFMTTSMVLAMMSSDRSSSVMNKRSARRDVPYEGQMPGQPSVPVSPSQQAAVDKVKQAMAGMVQTVKQAAANAAKTDAAAQDKGVVTPSQAPVPAAPAKAPVQASAPQSS